MRFALSISAEYGSAKAIVRIVSQLHRLIVIFHHVDLRNRAEELFEVGRVIAGNTGEYGGLEKLPSRCTGLPPRCSFAPFFTASFTCLVSVSSASFEESGPSVVLSSSGSPIFT